MIEAYFDGCCEPVNPGGTASYGAVIFHEGKRVWECSEIFYPQPGKEKETSNNVAEYSGFLAILEELLKRRLHQSEILVRGDSNLVIQQMFGTEGFFWRIKKGHYVPLAHQAQKLLKRFPHISGEWIPREQNGIADELSKAELLKAGVQFKIQPEDEKPCQ